MKARPLCRDRDFAWEWALEAAARRGAASLNRRYQPCKLIEGAPLQTSLGKDLYNRIFATRPAEEEPPPQP